MIKEYRDNKGFSMVELIIVVAILSILTGILAPQFIRYIEKSRAAVCASNMDSIIGQYQTDALENPPRNIQDAQALLSNIAAEHGGSNAAGVTGAFTGFCKSGGTYSCIISEDYSYLTIECSKHGRNVLDAEALYTKLQGVAFDDMPKSPYKTLADYFAAGRKSVDSEAIGTGQAYAPYESLADAINKKLIAHGVPLEDKSWRLYNDGKQYNMFMTERKITLSDVDSKEWIACEKYDVLNKKVVTGYVQVTTSTSGTQKYPIINGGTFTETKP